MVLVGINYNDYSSSLCKEIKAEFKRMGFKNYEIMLTRGPTVVDSTPNPDSLFKAVLIRQVVSDHLNVSTLAL